MKAKICIIEDDHTLAAMYQYKLENSGFKVAHAENGVTGLELIAHWKPELILLDLKMPLMNGDEMLEKLRQMDYGHTVRVIILTNISRDEAPQKLRLLNVDRYVVKAHYTPAEIVTVVKDVLDKNTST